MKTLFITDLDGTFLNSNAEISAESTKIINELTQKGLCFSVATARTYATVIGMFDKINLSAPIVLMNGVMIYDPVKKSVVKTHSLTAEQGKKMLEIYAEAGIFPLTYFLSEEGKIDIFYKDLTNQHIYDYVNQRNKGNIKRFHKTDGDIDFSCGHLVYMTSMDSYDVLSGIYEKIKKIPGIGCTFCKDNYTDCYFLETFCVDASKANAALDVKNMVGADRIIAFGDNLNDIPLFDIADECYAVSNAASELIAMSTGVIGSNDDSAVAKFISEYYRSIYG